MLWGLLFVSPKEGGDYYETNPKPRGFLEIHGRGDGDRQGDRPAGPAGTPGLHRPPPGQPVPHHQGDGQPPHQGPPHMEALLQRQRRGRHYVFAGVLRQGLPGGGELPAGVQRQAFQGLPRPAPQACAAGGKARFRPAHRQRGPAAGVRLSSKERHRRPDHPWLH